MAIDVASPDSTCATSMPVTGARLTPIIAWPVAAERLPYCPKRPMYGNPSGEHLKCHVCHHDFERPDMLKCQTHDAHVCSLCLSTDKVADHVLPAQN